MRGPGPGTLTRSAETTAARLEALRRWIHHADPPAELVALIDPATLAPACSLRRMSGNWVALALPPVVLRQLPPTPTAFSPAEDRRDALHDALYGLGLGHALLLPLEPLGAGELLLARATPRYSGDDACTLLAAAASLGRALSVLGRQQAPVLPARVTGPAPAVTEVAALFELTRGLARASSTSEAVQIACETIRALLAPDVCAVVLRIAPDEAPVAAGWPDAAQGEAAVARAAVTAGLPVPATVTLWRGPRPASEGPLAWVTSARNAGTAGLALAWRGTAPEAAQRVLASLYASLVSAAASITAQRRHEEERLRSVVNALPHGVALLSPAGRVRLANPAARVLLEALEAWPADTEPLVRIGAACLRPMLDEAQQGRAAQGEILLPTTGRTIALHVVPAADAGLALGGAGRDVVLILDDVTDARRSTAQLARAEKLSALGVLISGIVHEINNPLATILGYAQMLAGTPPAEQHERWIRTLEEEARRCQRIVANLLAFARPQETGRRPTSLEAIAERALALVAHSYRAGGIEAILQANADTPAVEADADAILQALVNLLTNALHALEGFEGRRTVQVTVAPEEDGWAVLAVRDSGPGIAPEHLDRVFDPFFTTKPEGKGTGLGLSLVAATVRDHHGVIDVESAPGRGACFKILLPVSPPAGAAAERPVEADASASSGVAAPMGTALAGASVLVVDDEPAVAGVLADILAQAGARATVERDAAHALELILAALPDAVIWDYSLAGLPGPALLRELECRAPQAVQRVVFASGDLLQSAPAEDGHGPPVLLKPFDVATVLRTTAAVVRGRQGAG